MYPEEFLYSKDHEWIEVDGGIGTVGITDYAQEALGDIVYLDLPEVGRKLSRQEVLGSVESVKAVSDIFSPVSGEVTEVNGSLSDEPERVNEDPHGEAWLLKLRIADARELDDLMSAADYQEFIKTEKG